MNSCMLLDCEEHSHTHTHTHILIPSSLEAPCSTGQWYFVNTIFAGPSSREYAVYNIDSSHTLLMEINMLFFFIPVNGK